MAGTLVAGLVALGLVGCGDPAPARATLTVAGTLAGTDTAGYARARTPRDLVFPADHGPHPGFKHEWWYFTGHLETDAGQELGFQLTFFRNALRPDPPSVASPWATRQAYMAHFAVTDPASGRFRAFERFDRGALGLAGAEAEPLRVWVGDWVAESIPEPESTRGAGERPAFRVRAAEGPVSIELELRSLKPVVPQGDGGLSVKGPEPGNASYYYSLTRLAARGVVVLDGRRRAVRGLAWLDREWGTSALSPGIRGWDWFSLQLEDGSELMLYRLREEDGETSPFSAGTFVDRAGGVRRLAAGDFVVEETGSWRSPRGGRYPSGWRIRVPGLDLALDVDPQMRDQELDLAFRYWEGAVAVRGSRAGRALPGRGYVELTGYADGVDP